MARAARSAVSTSSTVTSRWICCGYAGSGQRGAVYRYTCWNITGCSPSWPIMAIPSASYVTGLPSSSA